MIPYTPTASASAPPATPSTGPAPVASIAARPGFIPYTPGQTTPIAPLSTSVAPPPPPPTTGTAGQAIVAGNSLMKNIKTVPGQLASAITSLFPGKQIGTAIGNTLEGPVGAAQTFQQTGSLSQALNVFKVGAQQGAQANSQMVGKVAGDTAQAVTLPLSLALGSGTGATWWGRVLNAAAKYGSTGAFSGGGATAASGGTATQTAQSGIISGIASAFGGATFQTLGEALSTFRTPASSPVNQIENTIAPKLNAKETQAAINQGRVTRGSDTILFGKQPDIVSQSQEVKTAAQTIYDAIPGSDKMNDAELSTALNSKITETAQALRPQMEQTPVGAGTLGDASDSWSQLKQQQATQPEFQDNFTGNTKFQDQFERYLSGIDDSKTLADIWDARIAYDNAVPANVKNASDNSPLALQTRKTMWLQNRAILNSIINDTSSGLGEASQEAFANMSDMYMARQNIAAKAKIDLTGSAGLLPNSLNKKQILKWGLSAGGGALGLDFIAEKLGLPHL